MSLETGHFLKRARVVSSILHVFLLSTVGILLTLEKESYVVAENVSDSDLALLVCANTSSDVLVGFTVTVSVQNGTALGKLVLHYSFQCLASRYSSLLKSQSKVSISKILLFHLTCSWQRLPTDNKHSYLLTWCGQSKAVCMCSDTAGCGG